MLLFINLFFKFISKSFIKYFPLISKFGVTLVKIIFHELIPLSYYKFWKNILIKYFEQMQISVAIRTKVQGKLDDSGVQEKSNDCKVQGKSGLYYLMLKN